MLANIKRNVAYCSAQHWVYASKNLFLPFKRFKKQRKVYSAIIVQEFATNY